MSVGAYAVLLAVGVQFQPSLAHIQLAASQTLIAPGPERKAVAVAQMVGRIAGYTQWPHAHVPLRLCLAGTTRFSGHFDGIADTAQTSVSVRALGNAAFAPAQCDIVYIGFLDNADERHLIGAVHGHPVLTIAEHDATCRSGAMFCLQVTQAALSFDVSLDAVSRSRVRVDPRVLRLSDAHGDDR